VTAPRYGPTVTPSELAAELGIDPKTLRAWLRRTYPRDDSERGSRHDLSPAQVGAARQRWVTGTPPTERASAARGGANSRGSSDECYVLDLIDSILGSRGIRQHRFPWLLGDPGANGARVALPVDGYWPQARLVVEYRERQHDEPTPFFDKPDRLTVSGVHRGEQRRLYDERREREIPAHVLVLLIVKPSHLSADGRGRLQRRVEEDRQTLRRLLSSAGIQSDAALLDGDRE
jgi:hypothetical protein